MLTAIRNSAETSNTICCFSYCFSNGGSGNKSIRSVIDLNGIYY